MNGKCVRESRLPLLSRSLQSNGKSHFSVLVLSAGNFLLLLLLRERSLFLNTSGWFSTCELWFPCWREFTVTNATLTADVQNKKRKTYFNFLINFFFFSSVATAVLVMIKITARTKARANSGPGPICGHCYKIVVFHPFFVCHIIMAHQSDSLPTPGLDSV